MMGLPKSRRQFGRDALASCLTALGRLNGVYTGAFFLGGSLGSALGRCADTAITIRRPALAHGHEG
jgi:hypothetical protein